jgi:hypothetical protein
LRIVCPTYWYPQHADDTQATYVHDINRHLVRRGNQVTVVTPGDRALPAVDRFDGVDVVRFPMELPSDLSYGHVAQGKVSMLGRFARLAVMAHYMEAQYRATVAAARERGADVLHAHWAIPTGPAAVLAARRLDIPSVITMHGGDVYVNPEQGYDFPTRWYVRPPLRWTLRHVSARGAWAACYQGQTGAATSSPAWACVHAAILASSFAASQPMNGRFPYSISYSARRPAVVSIASGAEVGAGAGVGTSARMSRRW